MCSQLCSCTSESITCYVSIILNWAPVRLPVSVDPTRSLFKYISCAFLPKVIFSRITDQNFSNSFKRAMCCIILLQIFVKHPFYNIFVFYVNQIYRRYFFFYFASVQEPNVFALILYNLKTCQDFKRRWLHSIYYARIRGIW